MSGVSPPGYPMLPLMQMPPMGQFPGMPLPQPGIPAPNGWIPPTSAASPHGFPFSLPTLPGFVPPIAQMPYPMNGMPGTTAPNAGSMPAYLDQIVKDPYLYQCHTIESQLMFPEKQQDDNTIRSVWLGGLSESLQDSNEIVEQLLGFCGPILLWKRVNNPNGKPKTYGFGQFALAETLARALRLLPMIRLEGSRLQLKIDSLTKRYLEAWDREIARYKDTMKSPKENDGLAEARIIEYLNSKKLVRYDFGIETTGKDADNLSVEQKGHSLDIDDPEYVDENWQHHLEAEKRRLDHLYGDRLKRWEAHEVAVERERRRETEKDMEAERRKTKKYAALSHFLETFDLDARPVDLYDAEEQYDFDFIPDGHLVRDHLYRKSGTNSHGSGHYSSNTTTEHDRFHSHHKKRSSYKY